MFAKQTRNNKVMKINRETQKENSLQEDKWPQVIIHTHFKNKEWQ